jgi:hypothetical protein
MSRTRRASVLLVALIGVLLLTVGAALAGGPNCGCNQLVCVHTPGHQRAAAPPTASCHHGVSARTGGAADCTLRGCSHEREENLPFAPPASLPHPTTMAVPNGVGPVATFVVRSLLDRPAEIEPPPPRSSRV